MVYFLTLILFKLLSSKLIRTKVRTLMCTQVLQETVTVQKAIPFNHGETVRTLCFRSEKTCPSPRSKGTHG